MKNVLVTGSAGGMGKAICQKLSAMGCRVYGLDMEGAQTGEEQLFYPCDVRSSDSVAAAAQQLQGVELDAIVHTAGIYALDSLVEMPEEKFAKVFDVNLLGVYRVNKAFLPLMKRGGRILITTSELAPLEPLPFTGIYAVSKAALDKYAWSLRMELQLLDISVSVLRPGAVHTGLLNVSTRELDAFCEKTRLYSCNARRFKAIVNGVEARHIPPEKVAERAAKALFARRPKLVYSINRNPLLLLLNCLPRRLQLLAIKLVLRP